MFTWESLRLDLARTTFECDAVTVESDFVIVTISDRDRAGIVISKNLMPGFGHDRLDRRERRRGLFTIAPIATRPDGVGYIPAFELDPYARPDFRNKGKPDAIPGIRHTWRAPSSRPARQQREPWL